MRTKPAIGPLPAAPDCTCHICIPDGPDAPTDAVDRACINTVHDVGWQVMLVGAGGTCSCCDHPPDDRSEPAFAYTVGLQHRASHPELAMSGMPPSLMHSVLNYVAAAVMAGHRVRPGDAVEGALSNVPLAVDPLADTALHEVGIGAFSRWFHRRPVEVLQLVWPTTSGIFAWQPGAPAELDALQPPSWRVQSERAGGLAVDPPWDFPIDPDETVVVCTHVRQDNDPIRFVARHRGEFGADLWDVHCGRDHGDGIDQLQLEHAAHTVRAAPSLRALADLRVGECAERGDAFSPWQRMHI